MTKTYCTEHGGRWDIVTNKCGFSDAAKLSEFTLPTTTACSGSDGDWTCAIRYDCFCQCDSNKVLNQTTGDCELDEKQEGCVQSNGTWDSQHRTCDCSAVDGAKWHADTKSCQSAQYFCEVVEGGTYDNNTGYCVCPIVQGNAATVWDPSTYKC